jgi:hypothetical protein
MKHRYEFADASAAKSKKAKKQKAKNQRQSMATSVADKKNLTQHQTKAAPQSPNSPFLHQQEQYQPSQAQHSATRK